MAVENEIRSCESVGDFEKLVTSYGLKRDHFKNKNKDIDIKK